MSRSSIWKTMCACATGILVQAGAASGSGPCPCNGDVTNNGVADIEDTLCVLVCINGNCSCCDNSCDVDCDGLIDPCDSLEAFQDTCFPCISGACCTAGVCSLDFPGDCTAEGGVFLGDNTTCVDITCPADLIAWWRMELEDQGIVPDASGNGHNLTVNGSPTFRGPIVAFNDNGTLTTADSDPLDLLSDWTLAAWIRELSHDARSGSGDPSNHWYNKVRGGSGNEGGYAVQSDDLSLSAAIYDSNSPPTCTAETGGALALGTWYQLTITFSSATGTMSVYLDSTLVEEQTGLSCTQLDNAYPLVLGGIIDAGASLVPLCRGEMSDVRVYAGVLEPREITRLYDRGRPALQGDVFPCESNGLIDVDDILETIRAFEGTSTCLTRYSGHPLTSP